MLLTATATSIIDAVRTYYTFFTLGGAALGIAWFARTLNSKVDTIKDNHLQHIQESTAKLSESSIRQEEQHGEMIRLLGSIDTQLRK